MQESSVVKWKEYESLHLKLVMKFLRKAECFIRALHDQPTTKVGLLRCGFKRIFTDLPHSRDFPDRLGLYNCYRKNTTSGNTAPSKMLVVSFSYLIRDIVMNIFSY